MWRVYTLGISLSSVLFVIKVQIRHLKGILLSLLCILWWFFKVAAWGKLLWQIRHLKGLSLLCILWWFFKVATWRVYTLEISLSGVLFAIKVQIRHLKGLSPLCILWCRFRFSTRKRFLSQTRDLKGLSLLCILWWFFKVAAWRVYTLGISLSSVLFAINVQIRHLKGLSPLYILWCTFRFSTREKVLSQTRHLKAFQVYYLR